MKNRTVIMLIFALSYGIFVSGKAVVGQCSPETLIRGQIDRFIKAECEGNIYIRNEPNLIKFSRESEKVLRENLEYARVYLQASPLIIISSYNIESVKISNNKATVDVSFKQIGVTDNYGFKKRRIVPHLVERTIEQYDLIYEDGKWLIYEPPLPRICKSAMIKYYEEEVARLNKILDSGKASKEQKEFIIREKQTLRELRELNN